MASDLHTLEEMGRKLTTLVFIIALLMGVGLASADAAESAASKSREADAAALEGTLIEGLFQSRKLIEYRLNDSVLLNLQPGSSPRLRMQFVF